MAILHLEDEITPFGNGRFPLRTQGLGMTQAAFPGGKRLAGLTFLPEVFAAKAVDGSRVGDGVRSNDIKMHGATVGAGDVCVPDGDAGCLDGHSIDFNVRLGSNRSVNY